MAFRAKKVRIQIPCGTSGSILENPDIPNLGHTPAGCDGGCSDSPQSAVCPDPPPPPPPPDPPCGVPSHFFGLNPWDEVVDPADKTSLSPDELPLFREKLELKLRMLDVANEASTLARRSIEAKLKDVATAEKALKNRMK